MDDFISFVVILSQQHICFEIISNLVSVCFCMSASVTPNVFGMNNFKKTNLINELFYLHVKLLGENGLR